MLNSGRLHVINGIQLGSGFLTLTFCGGLVEVRTRAFTSRLVILNIGTFSTGIIFLFFFGSGALLCFVIYRTCCIIRHIVMAVSGIVYTELCSSEQRASQMKTSKTTRARKIQNKWLE